MTSTDNLRPKDSPVKLAFYMTGNTAKILRRCMNFLDTKAIAICPNFQSYAESKKEPKFLEIDYLYEGFNAVFECIDIDAFRRKYSSINLSEVLIVDKSHYKKRSAEYRLRYVCAMGEQIARILTRSKPEYIFFPIIESIDAMLAYRLAQYFGIKPIVYCHTRFSDRSFFSESHFELIPPYVNRVACSDSDAARAEAFLQNYRANPGPFEIYPAVPSGDAYDDTGEELGSFGRLLRNLHLKSGPERHNRLINLWISFQVRFQELILPIRKSIFYAVERFYIRPKPAPAKDYDYFPLHMSPEASINVPAPYFIDQIRVVDKILLERQGNRTLVVKEHPAMYGFRPLEFFRALKGRPFVSVVPRSASSLQLIKNASTVYSVTGTACLEAFLLGVPWVQYGTNFLLDWVRRREERDEPVTPSAFVRDVFSVSRSFVLYSPNRSSFYDQILFSRKNVENLCEQLRFHMEQTAAIGSVKVEMPDEARV
jgi:hypothetical protein